MQKRILITGAAGFIGFHTALALKKRGDFVIGLDNFNSYYDPKLKEARTSILKEQGIEVIRQDLSLVSNLSELITQHKCTHILHLAAQAGVRYAKKNPAAYLKSNIDGFCAILETVRAHPDVKLIYASSSSVYGCNQKVPFSEKDRTDLPANLYAATKKANELMAHSYHHMYNIEAIGLRYFTVYGPWGRPDMAYFSFTKAILAGEPIKLFNGGQMRRDFTYIDDIVAGTIAAIDKGAGYEIYNLGNNQPVEVLTFIELLEKKLNKKANKILLGPSKGEVPATFAGIEHSKGKLGFAPKISLDEGLGHFLTWYFDAEFLKEDLVAR